MTDAAGARTKNVLYGTPPDGRYITDYNARTRRTRGASGVVLLKQNETLSDAESCDPDSGMMGAHDGQR